MLLTPHIFAGMLFGSTTNLPIVPFLLGMISFFLIELIPHWDPENPKKKFISIIRLVDIWVSIMSFIIVVMVKNLNPSYILGGLGALSIYIIFHLAKIEFFDEKLNTFLTKLYSKIHYTDRSWWGIFVQIAICILSIAIIFKLVDFPNGKKFLSLMGF